ncbi:ACP phosphodiesterase, partial [Pseudomonas syringae]|nr:ACP phosphodiesterase [Pseudomonas syringae]
FDESGALSDKTRPFLQKFIDAFAAWVEKNGKVSAN